MEKGEPHQSGQKKGPGMLLQRGKFQKKTEERGENNWKNRTNQSPGETGNSSEKESNRTGLPWL